VSTQLRLNDFPTTPLYNIKAVVLATGISSSTLRAWERRYKMCRPQRSDSGYRLYSERDIVVIRWLKTQVDAGMAISQAVSWYENLIKEAGSIENTVLPAPTGGYSVLENLAPTRANNNKSEVRDFISLQSELIHALINYNESEAEHLISEAFSLYAIEEVGEKLFLPVLVEIGERWHRGELSITIEHFTTNYLLQRLTALLRAVPNGTGGALIWVGCAPSELHEVGAVLLSVYLRRVGYRVHYLGQNLPLEDFTAEVQKHQPAMILFSAATVSAVQELSILTSRLSNTNPRPIIGYGGQIFNQHPELRSNIAGVFMGTSAEEAISHIQELLGEKSMRESA
jgi:MerR family transcriptional regulator, light-induced transcriptional regulator